MTNDISIGTFVCRTDHKTFPGSYLSAFRVVNILGGFARLEDRAGTYTLDELEPLFTLKVNSQPSERYSAA